MSRRRKAHNGRRSTVMRVQDLELEREALELRLGLLSFRAIADQQGCSVATAHDRVNRALERLVPIEKAEQVRQQEAERLDAVTARVLQAIGITSTNTPEHPLDVDGLTKAAGAYATLAARKAKLLGLDVPVPKELKITSEVDAAIEALAKELAGEDEDEDEPVPAES